MNCLHCEDMLWVCEMCEAPWPCTKNDGAGMLARNATLRQCSRRGMSRLHTRRSVSTNKKGPGGPKSGRCRSYTLHTAPPTA